MALYKQGSADAQIKIGGGKLYGVFISSTSSGTFALYDSAVASTSDPKIVNTVTVTAGTQYVSFPAGLWFSNGLYIDVANTIEYTVAYE
ncbi:hypothetical protein EBT31_03780 [bacterium]|jgi:hypothetical protein|nr:hypothetical protein [bacterium]